VKSSPKCSPVAELHTVSVFNAIGTGDCVRISQQVFIILRTMGHLKNFEDMFSRFDTIPTGGRTGRRTKQYDALCIRSHPDARKKLGLLMDL